MKLTIVFACLLALAAAVADVKAESDVEISADQDVAEVLHSRFYGGRHGGYWRGRRSAEETKPEEPAAVSADQEADESYDRRYYRHGYYGFPYGSYGHWRGRRSFADEKIQVASDDQDANEWDGRGYYGPYGYRNDYGNGYGSIWYGRHW